jgi:hypothetical protein
MEEQDFDDLLADTAGEVIILWAGAIGFVLVTGLGLMLLGFNAVM